MKNLFTTLTFFVNLISFPFILQAQDFYTVTTLGSSSLTGKAINNSGKVAGTDDPNHSAFIWENDSSFYILNTRWGNDINSLGHVTGGSYQGSDVYAYIYINGQMIYIPPISGNLAIGNGINDSSWITGNTKTNGGTELHPFLFKDGAMIDLGSPGGGGVGLKINNSGWVVGYYTFPGGSNFVPFIYKSSSLEQLPLISGSEKGSAEDINDFGEVCGYNEILATFLEQAVKWDQSGNVISLEQLPGQRWSWAHGINNSGDIVGTINVEGVGLFAVLWKGDSLTVLNELIDPNLGISLWEAKSINDVGEILCSQTVGSEIFYYVITPPPTGIKEERESVLKEFSLSQNFPNPFNPNTTIKYKLERSEFISLRVYDVLGSEVATLVNEEKPAGGYQIEFDSGKLNSGTYFYKLQAGSFVETKKMVVLK